MTPADYEKHQDDWHRQADIEAEEARMGMLDKPVERLVYQLDVDTSEAEAKLDRLSEKASSISGLTKHPLASKGIWGGIVALVSLIAGALGYVITPEEQEAIVLAVSSLATVAGVILGIVGRWRAKTVIG